MAQYDAEVRASLKDLQATVQALDQRVKSANTSLRNMAASAQAAGRNTARLGQETRRAAESAKELERRFKGVGQAVTQAGGSLGAMGGRISALTELAGKLGPVGVAAGAAAAGVGIAANAILAADERGQAQAGSAVTAAERARRSLSQSALSAQDSVRQRMADAAIGINQGRAAALASSGQAQGLEDARAGLRALADITDQAISDQLQRAAALIAQTTGQTFAESVAALRAGGAETAVARGIAPGPESLAADALGIDRSEFSRRVRASEIEASRTGFRQVTAAQTGLALAQEGRASDTTAAIGELTRQQRELLDPIGESMREQLLVLRSQVAVQNMTVAAIRDLGRTLGMGEGSARVRLETEQAIQNAARARVQAGY